MGSPHAPHTGSVRRPVHVPRRLALAAGVLYAGLAALTRPLTAAAAVAVAIPAAVLLIRTARRRPSPALPDPRRRTAAAWAALVVLAAAVEVVAFVRQPAYDVASPDFPTLSLLLDPVTEAGPTRFLAWCCWLWAGWALARR